MAGGAGAGTDGGAGGGGGGGDGSGPSGGGSSSSGGRSLWEMDARRLLDPGLKVQEGLWDLPLKNQQTECPSD